MSFGAPPFGSDGVDSNDEVVSESPTGLLGRVRNHLRTWSARYVEMRLDAAPREK